MNVPEFARVTVLPRLAHTAFKGDPDQPAPPCRVAPLLRALESEYSGDVYLCGYAPSDKLADFFHRLSKPALAYYALGVEAMPCLTAVFLDVDAPGHKPPAEGWTDGVLGRMASLGWPFGWYRTPNGLRIVLIPREPVSLLLAEDYLARLVAEVSGAGVPLDETTDQWTRLFRAPRALGRDLPRDFSALAPLSWHPAGLVEATPHAMGSIVARGAHEYASTSLVKGELAPLYKRNPGLAEALYRNRWAVAAGERHHAILRACVDVCEAYETNDPGLVFRVVGGAATALLSVDRAATARDEVIRACEWACALRAGRVEYERAEHEDAARRSARAMGCAPSQVRQRLIADAGEEFFVWDEASLVYSRGYTHSHQIYAALKKHCPTLAGSYSIPDAASNAEVYRDCSVPVRNVVFSYYDLPHGQLDLARDTFYARTVRVDETLHARFHAGVDRWLRALGGDNVDRFLDWMSCVPRLDMPICALYIDAPPSVGKAMLAAGIARLWSPESTLTKYQTLLDRFNETLRYAPLVWADEKVPQDAFDANDSSVFRQIVGNEGTTTEAKRRAQATLLGYPRVLITANNAGALGIREDMSLDDLAAVRLRLGYIKLHDDAPAKVLEELTLAARGDEFVRGYTRDWVVGGQIAQHILWLAENREVRPGRRFLVEGWDSALTQSLAVNAGSTGSIATAIATAIVSELDTDAVRWFGGAVYVSATQIAPEWERLVGNTHDRCPSATSRAKALNSLAGAARSKLRHLHPSKTGASQGQYWKIEAEVIARLADERGIASHADIIEACSRKTEPGGPKRGRPSSGEKRGPALESTEEA